MNKKIAAVAMALTIAAPGFAFAQSMGDAGVAGVDKSGSPSERTRQSNAPRYNTTVDMDRTGSISTQGRGYDSGSMGSGTGYDNPIDAWAAQQAQQLEDNQ